MVKGERKEKNVNGGMDARKYTKNTGIDIRSGISVTGLKYTLNEPLRTLYLA